MHAEAGCRGRPLSMYQGGLEATSLVTVSTVRPASEERLQLHRFDSFNNQISEQVTGPPKRRRGRCSRCMTECNRTRSP